MSGESILIVDDNPSSLKLAKIVLSEEGYLVESASDAETALTVLAVFEPRLVLTDIQLPGMDGLELTRRLKAGDRTKDIVVLALTAHATKADEERFLRAGCDGYVSKPFDVDELPRTVAAFLDKKARAK